MEHRDPLAKNSVYRAILSGIQRRNPLIEKTGAEPAQIRILIYLNE